MCVHVLILLRREREGGREGGREREREGGRERGREGESERGRGESLSIYSSILFKGFISNRHRCCTVH